MYELPWELKYRVKNYCLQWETRNDCSSRVVSCCTRDFCNNKRNTSGGGGETTAAVDTTDLNESTTDGEWCGESVLVSETEVTGQVTYIV